MKKNDQLEKIRAKKVATPLDMELKRSDWYLTGRERSNYPPPWVELLKTGICKDCGCVGHQACGLKRKPQIWG